jgi:hypothetical protein
MKKNKVTTRNRKESTAMRQVHYVKKAPKSNKATGITKGKPFWWAWCRNGYLKRRVWTSPPTAWQLAELELDEDILSIQREMYDARPKDASDLEEMRDLWVGCIGDLADRCREAFDSLSEEQQRGPAGKLLEDRAGDLDQWIVEIEAVDLDLDENHNADAAITWPDHALGRIDEMAAYCLGVKR